MEVLELELSCNTREKAAGRMFFMRIPQLQNSLLALQRALKGNTFSLFGTSLYAGGLGKYGSIEQKREGLKQNRVVACLFII